MTGSDVHRGSTRTLNQPLAGACSGSSVVRFRTGLTASNEEEFSFTNSYVYPRFTAGGDGARNG